MKRVAVPFVLGLATFVELLGPSAAQAQTPVTILHDFYGYPYGGGPSAPLVEGRDGNFYGITSFGGSFNRGRAFRVTPAGTLTILHDFKGGGADGEAPSSKLIQGTDGNFYGTTAAGGASNAGTVFRMTPAGAVTIVHAFAAHAGSPSSITQASDGSFYGTTGYAGNGGTAFRLAADGTFVTLHVFVGGPTDGAGPGPLVQAADGNFYGTTYSGGSNACSSNDDYCFGTVFRMTPNGTVTILHSFAGGLSDGATPTGPLLAATDGFLYGTTLEGGSDDCILCGRGTVFRVSSTGTVTIVHFFGGTFFPDGGLVQATDGSFYGVSEFGEAIFRITASGATSVVHHFSDAEGRELSTPTVGRDGYLYGGAAYGGTLNFGTLYKMTTTGAVTILQSFFGGREGAHPMTQLVQASDGNFYGRTTEDSTTTARSFA